MLSNPIMPTPRLLALALGLVAALHPGRANAIRFTPFDGAEGDFSSTISYGLQVRAGNPSSTNIGNDNGGNVPTTGPMGSVVAGGTDANGNHANPDFNFLNGDDGNLNYRRGDIVSLALKGTHELGLKWGDGWRFLGRGSWVVDTKVDDTRATALSTAAKGQAEHNITLLDLWVSKELKTDEGRGWQVKLGNQVISWGEDVFIIGGVNSINALDLRKYHTPGTQLKEIFRPAPMAYVNGNVTDEISVEAYYQFAWNGFRFDPVGTFFSGADIVGAGQRPAFIPSSSLGAPPGTFGDRGAKIDPATNVVPFERDHTPPKGGQEGLALRGKPTGWDTELAAYFIRYHDKVPFTTVFVDPGLNTATNLGYYNDYGRDKNLFGVSFNTKVGPVAVGGELSYRPRDSVAIDPTVPQSGPYSFAGDPGSSPILRANGQRLTARGYVDEHKYQAHLTAFYFFEPNTPIGAVMRSLGATEGYFLAEAAATYYPKLNSSLIPYEIFPSYAVPTKLSEGYALEVGLTYSDAFGSGITLTPQFDFTQDVHGITPNALPFVQGRKSMFAGLNFDYRSTWRGQVGYSGFWGGGLSNPMRDRDFFGANVSYFF